MKQEVRNVGKFSASTTSSGSHFQVQQESNGGEMNSEGIQTSTLTLTEPDEDMMYTCAVTSGLYPDSPEGKVNVLLSLLNQPGLLN